jgi:acetylornithine deacetylase
MSEPMLPEVDVEACVALASDLIRTPSPSGQEMEVAALIADRLRTVGAEVLEVAPANVLATFDGGRPGPRRLFMTHTDTMAAGQMEDPYQPTIVDGAAFGADGPVLRGLGAAAPKSAVAAMIVALEAVIADGANLSGSIQLAIVTKDLLANHEGVRELVAEVPLSADWVIAGEPSGNRLVLGARGIAQIRIDVEGRAAHWGRPDDAANPLYGVGDILSRVRSLDMPTHPALGKATLSPFEVTSEFSPPHSPHRAALRVDRRVLPGEDATAVVEKIATLARDACAQTPGLTCAVSTERMMHPFHIAKDHALVTAVRARAVDANGGELPTTYITFSSNAGFPSALYGWPSAGFGPGEITDLGPTEHVSVRQLHDASRAYAAMMTLAWPHGS